MIATNPITGKDAVTLPIRRVVATFTNRAGKSEDVTLPIPPTVDEANALASAKSALAELLQTDPDAVRIGDKEAGAFRVYVAPVQEPSGFFTLE